VDELALFLGEIVGPALLALFRPTYLSGRAVILLFLGRRPLPDARDDPFWPVALRSSGDRRRRGTRCAIWRRPQARICVRHISERDRLQPTRARAWYRVPLLGQREGTAAHGPARLVVAAVHRARRLIRARARCEVRRFSREIFYYIHPPRPPRRHRARPILVSRVAIPSRSLDSALESSREPCATSVREMPRSALLDERTRGVRSSRV